MADYIVLIMAMEVTTEMLNTQDTPRLDIFRKDSRCWIQERMGL